MAVELILTENTHQAETMAHALCELNRQRQAVELEVFNQCLTMLAGQEAVRLPGAGGQGLGTRGWWALWPPAWPSSTPARCL